MAIIFKFTSSATNGLFAFAGDRSGAQLPENHGPWISNGNVRPNESIPHSLDRETIERAIGDHGYQLWRLKKRSA